MYANMYLIKEDGEGAMLTGLNKTYHSYSAFWTAAVCFRLVFCRISFVSIKFILRYNSTVNSFWKFCSNL